MSMDISFHQWARQTELIAFQRQFRQQLLYQEILTEAYMTIKPYL